MLFISCLIAFSRNAFEANKQTRKPPNQSTKQTEMRQKTCRVTYSYKMALE